MIRGARLYLVVLVAFAVIVWLAGCAPPPATSPLSERARFDVWVHDTGVRTVHETIGTVSGWYDPGTRTVHLDDQILTSFNTEADDLQATFWQYHEYAHAAALDMDLWIGARTPCEPHNCPAAERAAQCVAQVVTGITPTYLTPDRGYWSCPADWQTTSLTELHKLYQQDAS